MPLLSVWELAHVSLDSVITDFGSNLNTLLNLVGRLNKKMTREELMASIEKVLIVGGGISGLCLAIALRDRGIAVDIAEIKTEWPVYGVGTIQQSNVVRAMAELGIVDKYLAAAFPFEQPCIYAADGSLIAKLP